MAVDFIKYTKMDDQVAIQEAAAAGLRSMEHLIFQLSHQSQHHRPSSFSSPFSQQQQQIDCRELTDFTVSKFKKVISILDRTGHARFRHVPSVSPAAYFRSGEHQALVEPAHAPIQTLTHAPIPPHAKSTAVETHPPLPSKPHHQAMTLDFTKPIPSGGASTHSPFMPPSCSEVFTSQYNDEVFCISTAGMPSATSSFVSSVTGDRSVSNGKHVGTSSSLLPPAAGAAISTGKPPFSSTLKKNCADHSHSEQADGGRCHCSKKKKSRAKRTIRVPAISTKIADIPTDEYSWRKYGQKPIKGSPYPRGYYKCSTLRGCPARKHVERATDDPNMLIVTYEGEHRHSAIYASGGAASAALPQTA